MKVIISDTSPISNLSSIGKLDLLRQLFNNVIIPEAVFRELENKDSGQLTKTIKNYSWIEVKKVKNQNLVKDFQKELDLGEAEAIALCIELNGDLILIDEVLGREVAKENNIKFMGVLGILSLAKNKGLINEAKPLIEQLKNEAGFWISKSVYMKTLELLDES